MPRYYTVKLCIALQNPGFKGFVAEGLENPIFFKWNNKHFAHCSYYATRKSPRVLDVKPSNKMYLFL